MTDDLRRKIKELLILGAIILALGIGLVIKNKKTPQEPIPPPIVEKPKKPEPLPTPDKYTTTPYSEQWISYSEIKNLLKKWNEEAPEITEYGVYGTTSQGTENVFLRVGTPGKPKVLIHAAIHGNERLGTGATLYMLRRMLHEFGRNEEITWLIKNRDIYWVPVLSPDTYLKSRHVEGKDPNRDYPHPSRKNYESVSPVQNIREFHIKNQFKGVMSGHTWGRIYFWPSIGPREDQEIHRQLAREMSNLSGYDASKIGNRPAGYEIDFYYWKGAIAFVTEFGSDRYQHEQPTSAIQEEGGKNYPAYMLFIKKSPELAERLNPPETCAEHCIDSREE